MLTMETTYLNKTHPNIKTLCTIPIVFKHKKNARANIMELSCVVYSKENFK